MRALPTASTETNVNSTSGSSDAKAFPLAMAQEGVKVRIHALQGGKRLEMRLTSLGLNVGSELVVSQHQGGRMVVRRGETRLALGAGMAHRIMVVPG